MGLADRFSCAGYAYEAAEHVAATLRVSHVTGSILVRRGYETPDSAARFLAAADRHEPDAFSGIDDACATILRHARAGNAIVVHGDYDVDGVCSTALLVRVLRTLGARVSWHLPARADGYGLSVATVERLARAGASLLVTADCGITATAEVAAARALGLDVVVTDHHRRGDELPRCPIVHPTVCGYPDEHLCATGVVYKLAQALLADAGGDPAVLDEDLDLVALATIADVVPLRGENRRLVREGLAALRRTEKPGLRALAQIAGCDGSRIDETAVAFRLAPRLNAAGRIQRADAALELLLTDDHARAAQVADELDLLNRERQDTETRILFAAERARAEHPDAAAYVLAGEGWHPGVIGIVASRLVERYHRPCVVVALDGDTGRGSGRSISAYDLHAGLAACSDHLRRFGGHRAAAGLEIDAARVDAFRAAFAGHAASSLAPDDLTPKERVDAIVPASAAGIALAEELERMRPFGHGNPRPTLLIPAARLVDIRAIGADGQHARCTLSGGVARARAVAFRTTASALAQASSEPVHAAVRLELDEWRGTVEPRLILRALCPADAGRATILEPDFWPAFAAELSAPLERAAGEALPARVAAAADSSGRRRVVDRRDEGAAGIAGDLLSGGERVLILCADAARRSAALERVVASLAPGCDRGADAVALVSWDAAATEPAFVAPYVHLLALDPPCGDAQLEAVCRALPHACESDPPDAYLHLAWGQAEIGFARTIWTRALDLRPELAGFYRDLRAAGEPCEGPALERLLRGAREHARPPTVAARIVRVLVELGLVEIEGSDAGWRCTLLPARRTELERSIAFVTYRKRLADAVAQLDGSLPRAA